MQLARNWVKFGLGFVLLFVLGVAGHWTTVQAAAPDAVVINEIMYNPATGDQDDEFLELYNTTNSEIHLEGWSFTAGISLVFEAGVTIAPQGYLVVSPDVAQTQLTYGVEATQAYAPSNLSNGGETITLKDADGVTIDEVTYDDSSPWPTSPDGSGYSLERKALDADSSLAASWGGGLLTGGTPLAQNSLVGLSLAEISDVARPTEVSASQPVTITATVQGSGILSVELLYKVNFDSEATLTMLDDGTQGDGAAADGVYGIEIPGQAGGSLVRYRIEAENPSGIASVPSNDDSQDYQGYVVDDGTVSDLPILRWYTADSDFTDLTTNHLSDDVFVPAVVAIGDQVFDNAKVRVKGGSSVNFPKRKYKFELPAGYVIDQPGFGSNIDEFAIQVYFLNLSEFPEHMTAMALERYGFAPLFQRYVRVHKNDVGPSDFYGHYLFTETYDSTWRQANDFETGALYKEVLDKKTRTNENDDDITELLDSVQNLTGDDLKQYLYDNLDIANVINYNAVMAVVRNDDWFAQHNQYQYRNTETTGRWEYLPWDNDNSFMPVYFDGPFTYTRDPVINPLPSNQSGPFYQYRTIERALFQFDEFQQMYYRRVATIYDDLYGSGLTKDWFEELFALSEDTLADDNAKWGQQKQNLFDMIFAPGTIEYPEDLVEQLSIDNTDSFYADATPEDIHIVFDYGEDKFVEKMEDLRTQQILPLQQIDDPDVVVSGSGGSGDSGYLTLRNNQSTAVDISGWTIPQLGFTFPQGTVLPALTQAYLPNQDVAFRQAYGSGSFVLGQTTQSVAVGNSYDLYDADGHYIDRLSLEESPGVSSSPAAAPTTTTKVTFKSTKQSATSDQITPPAEDTSVPQLTCVLNTCVDVNTFAETSDTVSGGESGKSSSRAFVFAAMTVILITGTGYVYTVKKRK